VYDTPLQPCATQLFACDFADLPLWENNQLLAEDGSDVPGVLRKRFRLIDVGASAFKTALARLIKRPLELRTSAVPQRKVLTCWICCALQTGLERARILRKRCRCASITFEVANDPCRPVMVEDVVSDNFGWEYRPTRAGRAGRALFARRADVRQVNKVIGARNGYVRVGRGYRCDVRV